MGCFLSQADHVSNEFVFHVKIPINKHNIWIRGSKILHQNRNESIEKWKTTSDDLFFITERSDHFILMDWTSIDRYSHLLNNCFPQLLRRLPENINLQQPRAHQYYPRAVRKLLDAEVPNSWTRKSVKWNLKFNFQKGMKNFFSLDCVELEVNGSVYMDQMQIWM